MKGPVYQGSMPFFVLVYVNQNVIHIYCDPAFFKFLGENGVHHGLEGGRGIGKAKEHYFWLKQALISNERCFPLVSFLDADIIVSPTDIHFRE